jgi:zinc transport system substrate-binding protein
VRSILTLALATTLAATACGADDGAGTSGGRAPIVASFYPLAEAAQRIGGDCVDVTNLTPPGVEPHDLELAPDDVEAIATAAAVLTIGGGFQPAVEEATADAEGAVIDAVDIAGSTLPVPSGEAGQGLSFDPHLWLDPGGWAEIVRGIGSDLAEVLPASCDVAANADAYATELERLDAEFAEGLARCDRTLIVTNHAAFGYLARAYGLTQEGISGLEPDAEPSAQRIAELRDLVEREGVTTIFTEELVPPEVADTLASEAGVTVAVLHTLEGLTDEELAAGADYRSQMRENLATLEEALGCG